MKCVTTPQAAQLFNLSCLNKGCLSVCLSLLIQLIDQLIHVVVLAHQWKIVHGIHNNTLVLRSVFCYSPKA